MPLAHGSPSYLQYFGVSAQPRTDLQGDHRSSSFMEQKRFFRVTCSQCATSRTLLRSRSRTSKARWSRSSRGGVRNGTYSLSNLSARSATFSCTTCQKQHVPGWRFGAASGSTKTTQVGSGLGRSFHHFKGAEQRGIQTLQHSEGDRRTPRVERRPPQAFLCVIAD